MVSYPFSRLSDLWGCFPSLTLSNRPRLIISSNQRQKRTNKSPRTSFSHGKWASPCPSACCPQFRPLLLLHGGGAPRDGLVPEPASPLSGTPSYQTKQGLAFCSVPNNVMLLVSTGMTTCKTMLNPNTKIKHLVGGNPAVLKPTLHFRSSTSVPLPSSAKGSKWLFKSYWLHQLLNTCSELSMCLETLLNPGLSLQLPRVHSLLWLPQEKT